jgi:hypothetical protein
MLLALIYLTVSAIVIVSSDSVHDKMGMFQTCMQFVITMVILSYFFKSKTKKVVKRHATYDRW